MAKKSERMVLLPVAFNIDESYFNRLQTLKEEVREADIENIFSRLDNKDIYILAISIAIKNKLTPQKSKKSNSYFRTESITLQKDPQSLSALRSLIYSYKMDIRFLLPENAAEFYKIAENLANAGMNKTIELLQNRKKIDTMVLIEGNKVYKSLEKTD
jgi:hypothetical protein